jgi:serine protease
MVENTSPDDTTEPTVDRRQFLRATGAVSGAAAVSGLASATPGRSPGPKENEVLVGVSKSVADPEARVAESVPKEGTVVHSNETLNYVAVRFPAEAETARDRFRETVTDDRPIKYAERNATYETAATVNDPKEPDQYYLDLIDARAAWDTTFGSSDVTIAVLDTGVEYTHPELDENFRSNPGYDFVDNDPDPAPESCGENHGTKIAGTVAAETDNGSSIAGITQSTLIAGRVLGDGGTGSLSDIADGIQWAADQGAEIINLSFGGGDYTDTMKNAVSYAQDAGSLLVAAAGNAGNTSVAYPAAYSECVAVSAVDSSGNLASFSNTGSAVEVAAPGVDFVTLKRSCASDSYERLSGTSFSAAVVSGVAGLARSEWSLTNAELRSHLKDTAVDTSLSDEEEGAGIVTAQNAVETQPSTGGGGGGGSTTDSVTDSLSGYSDSDCWTRAWSYSSPSKVELVLDGPSDADFDLFANDGLAECPAYGDADYSSYTTGSQESITIDNPDTSTELYVTVDSYDGSGDYTLTITEYE